MNCDCKSARSIDSNSDRSLAEKCHRIGSAWEDKNPENLASIIRSAILLNAAVARQPTNVQFKMDLQKLCSDVLKFANAKQPNADLVDVSNNIAQMVKRMREKADTLLSSYPVQADPAVLSTLSDKQAKMTGYLRKVQDQVTKSYVEITDFISRKCISIMGAAPCKYALVGLGSLAGREITPYESFSYIIVLDNSVKKNKKKNSEYRQILEYFRRFSVIFQLIICNLKETNIAFSDHPDFTMPTGDKAIGLDNTCGISVRDLAPLESKHSLDKPQNASTLGVIKRARDMAKFLDNSERKFGDRSCIARPLTKTCFLSGDKQVFETFSAKLESRLHRNRNSQHYVVMKWLRNDLRNFAVSQNFQGLYQSSNCSLEGIVQDTTLLVAALGLLHKNHENSNFHVISRLNKEGILNDQTACRLSHSVAISNQLKLEFSKPHCRAHSITFASQTAKMVEAVGSDSLVECFLTTYNLQEAIKHSDVLETINERLNVKPSRKFMILSLLQFYEQIFVEWDQYFQSEQVKVTLEEELWIKYYIADSYYKTHDHGKALILYKWLNSQQIHDPYLKRRVVGGTGWLLYWLGCYENGIAYAEKALPKISRLKISRVQRNEQLGCMAGLRGSCMFAMGRYEEAYKAFMKQSTYIHRPDMPRRGLKTAECYYNIACCLLELGRSVEAVQSAQKALRLYRQSGAPASMACSCLNILGACYANQEKYDQAIDHFQHELKLRKQYVPVTDQANDILITDTLASIDVLQTKLHSNSTGVKLNMTNRL